MLRLKLFKIEFVYFIEKIKLISKLLFEITFILFIHFIEKLIQLIDKDYRITLEGFD